MAKLTSNPRRTLGIAFYGHTLYCSYNDLVEILGEPQYNNNTSRRDNTNYEWECITDAEDVIFTIYDWKEYRQISKDEKIEWHIGAHTDMKSIDAFCEMCAALGHFTIK
jgi:hypothetical protein